MTSIKILIDNNNIVYIGQTMFGSGEPAFQRALHEVPLSRFSNVVVEDERGDHGQFKTWRFKEPYEFDTLGAAVAKTEPERVDVETENNERDYTSFNDYETEYTETDFDVEQMMSEPRNESSTSIEPYDYVQSPSSPAPVDLEALDEAYQYMQATSYVEDDTLFPGQALSRRESLRPQDIKQEELDLAEMPGENGYRDEYVPYHVDGEDESFFPEHKDYSFRITQMPSEVSTSQYYGPGERTTNVPIAIKRSPITANKVYSKKPLYVAGVIVGLILIGLLIRWIASPSPTEWSAVCYDQRTETVLSKSECSAGHNAYANVGYVHTSDLGKLKPKSHLPKNYQSEEPDGNVEVNTNL